MHLDFTRFDNNIEVDISANQCLEDKNQSNFKESKTNNQLYFNQNILQMKMIIKEITKVMREKGLQSSKVMQKKKRNILNIKEVEKAMIKDLLLRIIKVKNLRFLIMTAIKFTVIYSKLKINSLLKKIVKLSMKQKNMIIDQIETKNIINKIKQNIMISKTLKIYRIKII